MQKSNESLGRQIATLRERKKELEENLEPLLEQVKEAHARGEDVSCEDYEVTVRGGGSGTTKTVVEVNEDRVRDLEALLPPDVYQGLWTVRTHKTEPKPSVWVKRKPAPMSRKG